MRGCQVTYLYVDMRGEQAVDSHNALRRWLPPANKPNKEEEERSN